jgi:hypothetical protein
MLCRQYPCDWLLVHLSLFLTFAPQSELEVAWCREGHISTTSRGEGSSSYLSMMGRRVGRARSAQGSNRHPTPMYTQGADNNLLHQDASVKEDRGWALHSSLWHRLVAKASGSCSLCFKILQLCMVGEWWCTRAERGAKRTKGMCCWWDKPTNTTFKATLSALDLTDAPQCIER